jgi:acrylyl-CoA reductase (NADPH)/3-hydroxypropionyl-CoA dehydratase/3-hydroxypropionyl-CoA synthetase
VLNAKSNLITTRLEWENQREAANANPGNFHGEIAKREIFWYEKTINAWIKRVDDGKLWIGYEAKTGKKIENIKLKDDFDPWIKAFNDSEAPFYKWFDGGFTNACFSEVDVHVIEGHGDEIAFIFEGDRWDPSLNQEKGGPVVKIEVTRKQLLWEVVRYAQVLKNLGLKKGDRIILNMPNILEQIYFIEASKRLGIIFTPVFGGFSAKTLSDRIHDSGAKIVITVDGAHRNAQVVPFKEAYTDKALDDYIPVSNALKKISEVDIPKDVLESILENVKSSLKDEITVERSDVMRSVGQVLEKVKTWDSGTKSKIRTSIAEALVKADPRVLATVVVQYTKTPDLAWNSKRDKWAHELLEIATDELLSNAKKNVPSLKTEKDLLNLPDEAFIQAIYASCPPVILEAEFPLFIMYTSGSTGKPKGVVHTHGGYTAGIAHTMKIAFDVQPGDVIYVVGDPGWITGQSYMISAALTTRATSVITEGSPLFPNAGRFTSIIERYKVNIFKAGSTFLKTIASDQQSIGDVKKYKSTSLKVATFCAEPTNPVIQQFAMDLLTENYINSYWATEHGGIVLTHMYGNQDFKLRPDAHCYPLPWIFADVWIPEKTIEIDGTSRSEYRIANYEEKGEIVITKPYPYLARTVWGDGDNFGKPNWKGDAERFKKIYFNRWAESGTEGKNVALAYTQGDYASKFSNGSMSLHGRSDDVINTSGHRIGTEEIEGAILKDKQMNPKSNVGNVIVVGAPHEEKGTVPLAFILVPKGQHLTLEDEKRLINIVREEKGIVAVPAAFIQVSQFPETRSGKYMRRFLRNMLEGEFIGDTSTLRNPESLKEIESAIQKWRYSVSLKDKQKILEVMSTLRIEYHDGIAIITINKPPVNALDERALDELNTVIDHLGRREDIKVLIITGAGTKSFVAGADIRQFLEEMQSVDDVLPFSKKADIAIRMLENMEKPVVAAINGLALGGGNEFQMGAHYRIAEPTARFGQTEINLHLIPGYGGTQRLPRLLSAHLGEEGLIIAADMIIGGRTISSEEALRIGLINEVSNESDALSRAVNLAKEYISNPKTSILGIEHLKRLKLNIEWEKPMTFSPSFHKHPEIERLIDQSKSAGRNLPAQEALMAIQFGFENGLNKGLENEAKIFAELVINPEAGKLGIQAFFDKKSAPLPTRNDISLNEARKNEKQLQQNGELLAPGAPFYPGITPIPKFQYALLVEKDLKTGVVNHGDPIHAELMKVIPVESPGPTEALLYMLTSEINYNDIWAITGVPVSTFDNHEEDWHVTGSGGLALVASIGFEMKRESRIKVGDLVAVFSGQPQLLAPIMGLDPMFADQRIQGYETPDGSHQQFMIAQGPQLFHKSPELTLEAAGSYMLNLGTIYRALFTTLKIKAGKRLFIEGAATGTGLEVVKASARNGLFVTGLISSEERAQVVLQHGGVGTINRKDKDSSTLYTKVPENSSHWDTWEQEGEKILQKYRDQNQGHLADYVISHAGETSFPRSFQLLAKDGILTFYGASTGYHFTFMGKPGTSSPEHMLQKAKLRSGESVLIFYGTSPDSSLDPIGLECIETAREMGARIVVCTTTDAQREFVKSMGFGESIRGVFSIEEIQRREGESFTWPKTMPELPNPKEDTAAFKEGVRWYQDHVFKPFASVVGSLLRTSESARNYPDIVIERASQDTLALSSMLVKPFTGRVIFVEDMSHRRYSFYAPQVWMRQRRIYMPTASIFGTHLSNSYEILAMNELINAGFLSIDEPLLIDFADLPAAHQEMWENRHRASNYVLNHALPQSSLKTKEDLYYAWSLRSG